MVIKSQVRLLRISVSQRSKNVDLSSKLLKHLRKSHLHSIFFGLEQNTFSAISSGIFGLILSIL